MLDPYAVADAQAIEAGLGHRLLASVESNANEIDILGSIRFADFLGDHRAAWAGFDRIDDGVKVFVGMPGAPAVVATVPPLRYLHIRLQ